MAFALRLAERLHKTVAQIVTDVGPVELRLWKAWDKLHPLDWVERLELAIATGTAFNVVSHGGPARDASFYLRDYGREYRERMDAARATAETRADPAALAAKVDAVFSAFMGG